VIGQPAGGCWASTLSDPRPTFLIPSAHDSRSPIRGDIAAQPFEAGRPDRGLYRLRGFPDAYLYVVWPVEPGVFQSPCARPNQHQTAYREAKANRVRIQFAFFVTLR